MNCSNCVHYGIYKMITSGKPYGYAGDIPCIRCSEYKMNSEFVSVIDTYSEEIYLSSEDI